MSNETAWKNKTTSQVRSLSGKRSLWLFPVLVILFIVGSAILLLRPSFSEWRQTTTEISAKETELAKLEAKRADLEGLAQADLDERLARLESVLPSHKPVFEFLAGIDQQAVESEVTIGAYTLSPGLLATESAKAGSDQEDERGTLNNMSVELEVTGTLEAITRFTENLELMAPLLGLQQMELSFGTSDISDASIQDQIRTSTIKLDLYYSLPPLKATQDLSARDFSPEDIEFLEFLTHFEAATVEASGGGSVGIVRENPFSY